MASRFAQERDTAKWERDRADSLAIKLRADLAAKTTVATTVTHDLAAANATIVALRAALEQKSAATTTATIALAAAQQKAARATSSENEAIADLRVVEGERDSAVATTADLSEDLAVQTAAKTNATTASAAAQEEAARATSWATAVVAGCRAAERERDSAFAAADDLRGELTVQTAANANATTALAAALEEAARDGLLADMTAETLQTLEQERNR
ncbi:unnamed protein product, partial [Laminaria digitata]